MRYTMSMRREMTYEYTHEYTTNGKVDLVDILSICDVAYLAPIE